MKYLEVNFNLYPCDEMRTDVLSAYLSDLGFDSFVPEVAGLSAFIPTDLFDEDALRETLSNYPFSDTQITYTRHEHEDKNWNEEWEKHYFQPIVIEDRCVIHSTFHTGFPQLPYEIIINPQMAFGTGHHETTATIIAEILDTEMKGKRVLDMGCGTAILGILARMKGASAVVGVDIDEWCVRNSWDNIALNKLDQIDIFQGDAHTLSTLGHFDIIIANINRNILLADMENYIQALGAGGLLLMSGFYTEDLPVLQEKALSLGLAFSHSREKNNWAVAVFHKPIL